MVEKAEPQVTDADVDGMALLGRDLAERACRIDEGAETEHDGESQLQQTISYCKEDQCNRNAEDNIPIANGLPLEGEWTVYPSGEMKNSNGGDAGREVEPVDSPNESEALVTLSIKSEGRKGSMDEPMELLTMSVEPDVEDGGDIPRVYLGNRADGSRGQSDTLSVLNRAVTTRLSHSDGARTYLATGDAKHGVTEMDGAGIHVDASSGRGDALSVETNALTTANETQIVSIPRKREKPPDPPMDTARMAPDEPNGCRNRINALSMHTDAYSVGIERKTAANETESVRTRRNHSKTQDLPVEAALCTPDVSNGDGNACGKHTDTLSMHTDTHSVETVMEMAEKDTRNVRMRRADSRMRNSPKTIKIAMAKPIGRWRTVSASCINVHVPLNVPVVVPGRTLAFGEVESSRDKAIAPNVEIERAGDGDGDDGKNGDMDGTTSSVSVDSTRVNEALLAVHSQHKHQSRRKRAENLPVSSRTPIQPERRSNGLVRWRRRRGRLKIERINVNKAEERETAYLEPMYAAQPPRTDLKRCWEVHRHRRQRGHIRIGPVNVKIERLNDKTAREDGKTHLERIRTTQPPRNAPKRRYGVIGLIRWRGCIKIRSINVNRAQVSGNTYLGRANVLQLTWRPKKNKRRLDGLTFEFRMPGEPWRNVEDYG